MAEITISSKYQVVIPKAVREKLHLKSGQKMSIVVKGNIVHLIPEKPLEFYKGFTSGLSPQSLREDEERF
jgi:AbrB family looped-hinge helix DNA binding protein